MIIKKLRKKNEYLAIYLTEKDITALGGNINAGDYLYVSKPSDLMSGFEKIDEEDDLDSYE